MKIQTKLTGVALAATMLSGTASAALVSHFAFEGDATNGIGGQAAGTENGTVTYAAGKFWQAVSLDAASDKINLSSTSLGAIGSGDFSLSLWVQLDAGLALNSDPAFFSNKNWDTGFNQGINLALRGGTSKDVSMNVVAAGGSRRDDKTKSIADGNWHNIILVRSGSNLDYYFDGTLSSSNNVGTGNLATGNNFILGDDGTAAGYNTASVNWTGDMLFDELSVYDTALTTAEISTLQTTAVLPVPEPSSAALLGLGGLSLILRRRK